MEYFTRVAKKDDLPWITAIYNQGIEDRVATFETCLRTIDEMEEWFVKRGNRFKITVIHDLKGIPLGWASINEFHSRCCYNGVGDISIYMERDMRGKGLGKRLLGFLVETAKQQDFHKLVLSTFDFNTAGKRLYQSLGFRVVGTYRNQGLLDGIFVDVTIMEKLL